MKRAATWLAALATGGAAFLVLLLYAPALQAPFLVPKFGALEAGATLGVLAFGLSRLAGGGPFVSRPVALGAAAVLATTAVAWVLASRDTLGAPYAPAAMARWAALFGVALGASVLGGSPATRQRVLEAVAIAAGVVSALGLLQHVELLPLRIPVISTPGSTFGNRNLAAEAVALALPLGVGAAMGAPKRDVRVTVMACLALGLVYLAVTRARGAWLGAAGGVVATIALSRMRIPRKAAGALLVTGLVAAAAAVIPGRFNPHDAADAKRYAGLVELVEEGFDARSTALKTRLGLWRRTLTMIGDHPLAGVGPGNWPRLFPRYAEPNATQDGVLSTTLEPRQAHEDFLERTAETGVFGLLALGALGAGVAIAVRRRLRALPGESAITASAAGVWVALGLLCLASFPFEMPGTLTLAGIALGLLATDAMERARPVRSARSAAYAALAGGLALLPLVALRVERNVRTSFWLGVAERALRHDRGPAGASAALGALSRSLEADPDDFRAELQTANANLTLHDWSTAADAATRALRLEPYSLNALSARAAALLGAGDLGEARREATRALDVLQDCPLALRVRADAAALQDDAKSSRADEARLLELANQTENVKTSREAQALLKESPPVHARANAPPP